MKKNFLLIVACFLWVLLFLFYAGKVKADAVYTGAWSWHKDSFYERAEAYNRQVNPNQRLFAIEVGGYVFGRYDNSIGIETDIFARAFKLGSYENFTFRGLVGASYGYYECLDKISKEMKKRYCALVIPEILYTKYKIQPSLTVFMEGAAIAIRTEF